MPSDIDLTITPLEVREVGKIKGILPGIVKATGLLSCFYGQLVTLGGRAKGMVIEFSPREAAIIVLGDHRQLKVGDMITSDAELLSVPVGDNFRGRIVDCLAQPVDGLGKIKASDTSFVFRQAPGIMEREPINKPLLTGIRTLDLTVPIGKGQRMLILGDRQTGKTSVAVDILLNQKEKDVICIFCFIGGTRSDFEKTIGILKEKNLLPSCITVCAFASQSPGEQFICPYTAASLGEYFMHKGKDVLVVFDDLTKHAWAYRQLSLLLERSPGREAYPGDIFYIHSQLMERAGQIKKAFGGGTMSFLPVIETLQGDITGYIPSNLIAMTDGQIYLNQALFHEGFKPAIDVGLSVSRIGGRVQPPVLRSLGEGLRLQYVRFREFVRMMKLKTGLSQEAQQLYAQGRVLEELFIQDGGDPRPLAEEVILFYAYKKRVLEVVDPEMLRSFKREILEYLEKQAPDIVPRLEQAPLLSDEIKKTLDSLIVNYFRGKKGSLLARR